MNRPIANPVVHLELQTANLARARALYMELFGWSAETVRLGTAKYLAFELGMGIQGGMVEREGDPAWLPYVEVPSIVDITERARLLGAAMRLGPREGPAGWRCVLAVPSGAEIALWQPKA